MERAHKLVVLAVLGLAAAGASSSGGVNVEVVSVQPIPLARIRVLIHNASDAAVFVPYCGDRGGAHTLCGLAAHLEVKTKVGWQEARDAQGAGLSGGVPLTESHRIGAGDDGTWEYEFLTNAFRIRLGDRLRLVIDAWHNQAAVTTEKPTVRIATEAFVLPTSPTR